MAHDDELPVGVEPAALSIPAAARYLGISERQMWNFVGTGQVPSVTIGRRRLIVREELDRALRDGSLTDGPKKPNGGEGEAA